MQSYWLIYKWWIFSIFSAFIGIIVIIVHNLIFKGYNLYIVYALIEDGEFLNVSFTIIILAALNNYRYIKSGKDLLNVSIGFVALLNAVVYTIIRYADQPINRQVALHMTIGFLVISIFLCFLTEKSMFIREG